MRKPYASVDDHTLYLGDAGEVMSEMPSDSIQTIIAGPPYFEARSYGNGTWSGGNQTIKCDHKLPTKDTSHGVEGFRSVCARCGATRDPLDIGLPATVEEYVAMLVPIFREARRVLKENGTLWLVSGDTYSDGTTGLPAKSLNCAPWKLAIALQNDGWMIRSDVIWQKPSVSLSSASDRPTRAHDYIFLLIKNPRYKFYADKIREPNADGTGTRHPRTVWTIQTESYRESGYDYAVFPRRMVAKFILASTDEGDTVLSPFDGVATVDIIAMQLNRPSIGIELSPSYIALAHKRLISFRETLSKKA